MARLALPACLVTALVGAVVGVSACTAPAATPSARSVLHVADAFNPLSSLLVEEYQKRLPHLDVQMVRSPDSTTVIRDLESAKVDVGVSLADAAFRAYWGDPPVSPEVARKSSIRAVSLLQPLSAYVLVRAKSGVRSISDLQGRNVGLGPRTASASNLAYLVLDAFGVTANLTNVSTRREGTEGLQSGRFDAIFLPGYTYPDDLTYAAIKEGAYLIPIEGPALEQLRWNHPFVRVASIPRDIYPGQNAVIPTVGIDMVVLCRRDLDESLVHQLVAELFNAYPQLAVVEASLRFLNINEAPATPIPLHPGAARYFREREVGR